MRFRRKNNDGMDVTCWYWDGTRKAYEQQAPDWVRACTRYGNGIMKIEGASRMVCQAQHCWIIREQSDFGAYPMNVLTFESIYAPIL